jgi:hypothetical protein
VNQSGGGEILPENAHLNRQPNSLSINIKMMTPEPGSYSYPDGIEPGAPEVFTGWAFVFNHPENCSDPCGPDDLGNPDVVGSVYNFAGHVKGNGGYVTFSGHINVGQESFALNPLTNPEGAEVHIAIAPHGQMDPSTLPNELRIPAGSPACDCWWVAIFAP